VARHDSRGALTFVGGGRYGTPSDGFSLPTNLDAGPMANRYAAGTFIYTDSAPIPEPASMFLLGSGLFAIGMRKLRKSR
jgi:PEP-CTERM motif